VTAPPTFNRAPEHAVVWDERLITRHHAADLAGTWDLTIDAPYLRCAACEGNVTMLPGNGKLINTDGIISLVVGHMVRCHGYSLSGSGNGNGTDSPQADHARLSASSRGADHPGR
jgi:hypothetical protein